MSSNRFFVMESGFEGEQVRFGPEQAHQIGYVLRLRAGDTVAVLDDSGTEYDVVLTAVRPPETTGRITGKRPAQGEPKVQVTLFQSLLSREKFEWVLQKGTEVGVRRFVPVLTQRSVVRAKTLEERRLARWRRILTEAAEQSHRGRIPELDQEMTFGDATSRLAEYDRCLIAAPLGEAASVKKALIRDDKVPASVALLIGPEGGFTEGELALACEKGALQISLGPRILRTETAAVLASALILYELGQMEP